MWQRWRRYEFWPFWIFYLPFIPVWLWYSLRCKAFTYFCNANPGLEWGGFTAYSKSKVLENVPHSYLPQSQYLKSPEDPIQLNFPLVAKPDMGERGKMVELIHNQYEWEVYRKNYLWKVALLIQDFMPEKEEYALFYVRLPKQKKGQLLSITAKGFARVVGDGEQTLRDLVRKNIRVSHRLDYLERKFGKSWTMVLAAGEEKLIEEIGNHNRGTTFLDASNLINEKLNETVDAIAKSIPDFYYGRLDVKSESTEALQKGQFRIIEINGSNSEATHIYDPKHSLAFAYKEVARHLSWQFKIAKQNHENGHKWHSHRGLFGVLWKQLFGRT